MSDHDDDSQERTVVGFVVAIAVVVAIVVSLLAGFAAIWSSSNKATTSTVSAPAVAAPVAAAHAAAAHAAAAEPSQATNGAIAGPVKLYFETGKTEPAAEASGELSTIVEAVKAQRADKAVVSGFHDKTGNPEVNAEVSKQRALAVAKVLAAAGLSDAQIELRKPQETTGEGNDREARRVEVTAERN